jgi:tetratricopeptide (TPR) repeat protein
LDLKMGREQVAADLNKEAGEITTSSPEAFKYFTAARVDIANQDYEAAIPLLEKAIALDPGFANAYRTLGMAEVNLGHAEKSKMYLRKAFDLRDRVSERERYIIEGSYYSSSEKTCDKAIEAYTKLLDLYPNDRLGNNNLAAIYGTIEERDKAIKRYEWNTKILKNPGLLPWGNLARSYEAKGLYDQAREVLEEYAQNFPDSAVLRLRLSGIYIDQGKYDLALDEANKALALDPTDKSAISRTGEIRLLKGDLIEAEEKFQNYLETGTKDETIEGKDNLAYLYLLEGKFGKSKEQIQQALELSRQAKEPTWESNQHEALGDLLLKTGDFVLALKEYENAWERAVEADNLGLQREALWKKGLAYIGLNSIEKAQKTADELKEMIEKGIYKKIIRLYYHLQGSIDLERKNYPLAIEYLRKAVSSVPAQGDAILYDTLALAFFKSGDLENAQKAYETIVSLTWGRLSYGDIYAKGFYHLALIDEKLGDKAKARENYRKFLDLWKDADPGLPEVEDARKRLAGLK